MPNISYEPSSQTPSLYYKKIPGKSKKALVFLHGLGGSHHFWKEEYKIFSQKYSLYFIDLLGFGRSPKPNEGYTIEKHTQALEYFLSHAVIENEYTLIGHSLGALIALYYTLEHTQQNQQAILLATPYYHTEKEAHTIIQRATKYPRWLYTNTVQAQIACSLLLQVGKPFLQLVLPFFLPNIPSSMIHDFFSQTYRSMIYTVQYTIVQQNISKIISSKVANRLVFLHGYYDNLAPIENVTELSQRTHAQLVTLSADHGFPFTKTAETIRILKDYV